MNRHQGHRLEGVPTMMRLRELWALISFRRRPAPVGVPIPDSESELFRQLGGKLDRSLEVLGLSEDELSFCRENGVRHIGDFWTESFVWERLPESQQEALNALRGKVIEEIKIRYYQPRQRRCA